jgi:hypothetical protein
MRGGCLAGTFELVKFFEAAYFYQKAFSGGFDVTRCLICFRYRAGKWRWSSNRASSEVANVRTKEIGRSNAQGQLR